MKLFIWILLIPTFLFGGLMDFISLNRAEEAYRDGEYQKSVNILKSLKRDTPIYQYNLGNSYYKAKKYDKAIEAYKRAKGDGVEEHYRLYNLGNSYFKRGELKNAVVAYEESLKIKDDKDTKHNLEITKKLLEKRKKREQDKKNRDKNRDSKSGKKSKDSESKKSNNKKSGDKRDDKKKDSKNGKDRDKNSKEQSKGDKRQKDRNGGSSSKNKKDKKDKSNQKNGSGGDSGKKNDSPNSNPQPPSKPKYAQPHYQKGFESSGGVGSRVEKGSAEVREAKSISDKELKRLMKRMRDKKMPTLMYRTVDDKRDNSRGLNPW